MTYCFISDLFLVCFKDGRMDRKKGVYMGTASGEGASTTHHHEDAKARQGHVHLHNWSPRIVRRFLA
jgi:hypothetical protein